MRAVGAVGRRGYALEARKSFLSTGRRGFGHALAARTFNRVRVGAVGAGGGEWRQWGCGRWGRWGLGTHWRPVRTFELQQRVEAV